MINLNDLVTFVGTPTLITWSYSDCATPSPTPAAGQPVLTSTSLGTIDPVGAPAGSYTYNVTYTDAAMTSGVGCDDYCVSITVTVEDGSMVSWNETMDGFTELLAGTFTGNSYYHVCCFNGNYATEDADLDFQYDLTPSSNFDGTQTTTVSVQATTLIGPSVTPFNVGFTGSSLVLTQANILAIMAAGSNAGADIGEATMDVLLHYTTAYDTDTDPANDNLCEASDSVNLLIAPCIQQDSASFDCALVIDTNNFDLYDFILNAGTGNTAPNTALTGGVGNQIGNPQGGAHYWVLTNVDAELYAAITDEGLTVVKTNPDTITITGAPTTSTILSLDLTSLTPGPHSFTLTHVVQFNETNYLCEGTAQTFNIDTALCCTTNTSVAPPITLCN